MMLSIVGKQNKFLAADPTCLGCFRVRQTAHCYMIFFFNSEQTLGQEDNAS